MAGIENDLAQSSPWMHVAHVGPTCAGKTNSGTDFAPRAASGMRGRAIGCRGRADLGHKEP